MELEQIRKFVREHDTAQEAVDEEKANVKAILERLKAQGTHPGGFKSALKLRKLKPTKLRVWLQAFDETRAALGLDDQLDLEVAIQHVKAVEVPQAQADKPRRGRRQQLTMEPEPLN